MKKTVCFLIICLTAVLTGCIAKNEKNAVDKENVITYYAENIPDGLIHSGKVTEGEGDLLYGLFEGLVAIDEEGVIKPALAESWEVSADKLEYRFKLRAEAKWSDGTTITSKDFLEFFKMILGNQAQNFPKEELYSIYGAKEFAENKGKSSSLAIKAEDEKNLIIRLNYVNDDFLKTLASPVYGLRKELESLKDWKKSYKDIKYTGAFTVSNIDDQKKITLKKNQYYWDKQNVFSGTIDIKESLSSEKSFAEYEVGSADIIVNPPITEMERVVKEENCIVFGSSDKIGLELNDIALEENLRRAVALVINGKDVKEKAFGENLIKGNEIYKVVSSNSDYALAQNYLKQTNQTKKKVKLIAENNSESRTLCNVIKTIMKESLGLNAEIEVLEAEEFEKAYAEKKYDIALRQFQSSSEEYQNESDNIYLFYTNRIVCKSSKIEELKMNYFGNIDFKSISFNGFKAQGVAEIKGR